jgi:hypothetical protein
MSALGGSVKLIDGAPDYHADETKLYKEWITNDRRMRRLIEQMPRVAAKAGQLKMKEVASS